MFTVLAGALQALAFVFLILNFRFGHTTQREAVDKFLQSALLAVPRLWPPWKIYRSLFGGTLQSMRERRKKEQAARRGRTRPYVLDMFGERYSPGPLEMMVGGLTLIAICVGITFAAVLDRRLGLTIVAGAVGWSILFASTSALRPLVTARMMARRGRLSHNPVAETLALYGPWPSPSALVRRTLGVVLVLPFHWLAGVVLVAVFAVEMSIVFPVLAIVLGLAVVASLLVVHVVGAQLYLGDRVVALTRKLTSNPSITGSPLEMLFVWTEAASFALFLVQWLA